MPPDVPVLTTDRLVMRSLRNYDRGPFAAINADPVVMERFPAVMTTEQSDAFVDRVAEQWRADGWGLWALERRDTAEFVGYAGFWPVRFEARFRPLVEIGWRLAAAQWGQGFATEAARTAVGFAFDALGWREVVSFTAVGNVRSRAVMERLGMRREPQGDFEHPPRARGALAPAACPLPADRGGLAGAGPGSAGMTPTEDGNGRPGRPRATA